MQSLFFFVYVLINFNYGRFSVPKSYLSTIKKHICKCMKKLKTKMAIIHSFDEVVIYIYKIGNTELTILIRFHHLQYLTLTFPTETVYKHLRCRLFYILYVTPR